jgi:regulator of sigma E protease
LEAISILGIFYFIIGIILFVLLVVVHELGHAIVARRNGVIVEEFGVGFPPRAWKKKLKNGTLFTVNWLPLGGFVRLKGEHDSAKGPGTYGGATLWVKTKILLAGVAMNWISAVVIFTILALSGIPELVPNQFAVPGDTRVSNQQVYAATVANGSPAQKAGIETRDIVVAANGQKITSSRQLVDFTSQHAGQRVTLTTQRGGKTQDVAFTLNKEHSATQGYAGISSYTQTTRTSTWSAPIVGVGLTAQLTWETLKGLGATVAQLSHAQFSEAGQNVAGPVGIFSTLKSSSDFGFRPVLFLIGIISLTLAVMNALPIPALDGGRLFVTLLYRVLKKPLSKEREENIQAAGFWVLMVLVVLVTVVDIGRLMGK